MIKHQETIKDLEIGLNIGDLLVDWYEQKKRKLPWRTTKDPYTIWVSEVMLQQTQVKTVIPYFERFIKRFPNIKVLGEANYEDVLSEWRGLGYYSRARRMWEGANYILTQSAGKMPPNYEELLKVPGIGKYTAGAVASIAYGQKVSAIDGNVLRVMSRLLAWPEPVESVKSYRYFDQHIAAWQPCDQPGDFNQALMELGAMICNPTKPNCGECPLIKVCLGKSKEDVQRFPIKRPKPQRQEVIRLTFVLRQGNKVYLQKRPSQGLLANLWELPGVEILPDNKQRDLLTFSQTELFHIFQEAVSDRSFDKTVREKMAEGFILQGPLWYNFSHRRWKFQWICYDMCERHPTQGLPFEHKLDLDYEVLREENRSYFGKEQNEHLPKESRCWVSLYDLDRLPLPVAFREMLKGLSS
jgi:A/G-specific adenine glycosylase